MTIVRDLIAIDVKIDWKMHQMDANNVFLHGELDENFYMKLSHGLIVDNPNQVYNLQKPLYGLKLVSSQWYAMMSSTL